MKLLRSAAIRSDFVFLLVTESAEEAAPLAEQGKGVAFGWFDIRDSDLTVTHAIVMRIKPTKVYMGASGERRTVDYQDGHFFTPDLLPCLYAVVGFFSGNKPRRGQTPRPQETLIASEFFGFCFSFATLKQVPADHAIAHYR